jgi:hypothetical protein
MNRTRTILMTCLLSFSFFGMANAQVEKLKAAYIYNFATMSNYPSSAQGSEFIIAVMGNSSVIAELELIAKTKKVGSQSIVVKKINSPGEIGNAHILFIPDDQKGKIADAISKTSSTHTVVVAETSGSCSKGAIFNLLLADQKIRFEVNEPKANAKGIKLAANLVKLGIPVN